MTLSESIVFFVSSYMVLAFQILLLIFGDSNDRWFSDSFIKKMTVPKDSFLRKLVIFREARNANPKFLYFRVIPYLINLYLTIICTMLYIINQFFVFFIPPRFFLMYGACSIIVNFSYGAILSLISHN